MAEKTVPQGSGVRKQRFEFYQSERSGHLDKLAIESWKLYHNDCDGTNTQFTKKQIEALDHLRSPVASIV